MKLKPSKINVRPGNNLEGDLVVWIYGRKVQIQLTFSGFQEVKECINEAVAAWYYAMEKLGYKEKKVNE